MVRLMAEYWRITEQGKRSGAKKYDMARCSPGIRMLTQDGGRTRT